MSNCNVVTLEGVEWLKCSRPNCGGPADIVAVDGDVYVVCQHCTNSQTIYSPPEQDYTLFDAVQEYISALDSPRYATSHQQSVERTLTALRQVFLHAS